MSLVYTEEQQLLADTAAEFLMAKSPVTAQRKLRDEGVAGGVTEGFDAALWREMVDMGWSAIPFPEALGGLEFGCKGLGAVFEQIGRNLSASPLLSSIVLGGSVIELAGSEAQQWLNALGGGDNVLQLDCIAMTRIRLQLAEFNADVASHIGILYGGSVKFDNAVELFGMPDIDGGLIGGASLDPQEFLAICRA